jgi:alkylation response protein AidB-like acyl-CoA dehydrogenase
MAHDRRLPLELANQFAKEGVLHLFAPQNVGGSQLNPRQATEIVEALSAVDGSSGWASMIGSQWSWFMAFFDPGLLRAAGTALPVLAGALKPGGKSARVDGGYRVSGRWQLASGSTYADYLVGTCLLVGDGASNGQPELRIVIVPVHEATVLDTWYSAGLRGTGSNDFAVNDVFVPDERVLPYPQLCTPSVDSPLYRDRYFNLMFTTQAGQALGVARSAFSSFRDLAAARVRWASTSVLNESAVVRTTAAEAYCRVESLRSWLYATIDTVWDTLMSENPPTGEQRLAIRLAITSSITGALSATELLFRAAGAGGLAESAPLHRQYQDLLAAGAHVQATPVILEHAGAQLLADKAPPPVLF